MLARGDTLLAESECVQAADGETAEEKTVRFRTIGDMTCTGAVESKAANVQDIIREIAAAGADTFVSGSGIFSKARDEDPNRYDSIVKAMREELAKAQ